MKKYQWLLKSLELFLKRRNAWIAEDPLMQRDTFLHWEHYEFWCYNYIKTEYFICLWSHLKRRKQFNECILFNSVLDSFIRLIWKRNLFYSYLFIRMQHFLRLINYSIHSMPNYFLKFDIKLIFFDYVKYFYLYTKVRQSN